MIRRNPTHYQPPQTMQGGSSVLSGQPISPGAAIRPAADPVDMLRFMFGVGIECSYPKNADGRMDLLRDTGHYELWQTDLKLVRELGLRYLRYGPPLYKMWKGPGDYDWSFLDPVMHEMRRLGIVPIVDLVHFGLPDWLGDFQNPEWPKHFGEFAHHFAERYPWVRYYTPVNEIYVTAQFSAAFGWWNEMRRSEPNWYETMTEPYFVTAIKNCVHGSVNAMRSILDLRPDAIFVYSESTEYVHPGSPDTVAKAHFMNERRFLSLDLLFGHDVSATVYRYLLSSGMSEAEYLWFMGQRELRAHCIMGTDYYITNEHVLRPDGRSIGAGDVYGYYVITRQYYDRYRVPVMHTETNRVAKQAVEWLWKEWMNLLRLREDGVPIVGFTWFGLVDMMDWDSALTRRRGTVNPVGLYTLGRTPRKVAKEYRRLVEEYSHLPISSTKFPILTA